MLSDAQRAAAIAYVVIGADGQPRIHEQLYAEPAREDVVAAADEGNPEGDGDPEEHASEVRYSQKLLDELATMKTELLAVHVATDPHFALDLGTFIMVDNATRFTNYHGMPSELRANAPSPRVQGFESGTAAAQTWAKFDQALDRTWTGHKEIEGRYDAFCALDDAARAAWLGWAVARTLHAVPDGREGSGFLNHLGAKLGIDVAAWWRPTARTFFDRITKPAILKLFEAIGGADLRSRYAASRKFDLAASAERLFAGQVIAETDVKERALAWLPAEMRFGNVDVEPSVVEESDAPETAPVDIADTAIGNAQDALPKAA
jgi:ParB family transcriptional regulator, chromosome partitioning protein